MASGTESTEFIVGMVFFGIGVILLVIGIIAVAYFCIYRRRKNKFKKKQLSNTNNSIIYTNGKPKPGPLAIAVPENNNIVHENGQIKSITTLSPLESPRTIYSIENGSSKGENFLLTTAGSTKPQYSFDTVDNNKYVLREVYRVNDTHSKKKKVKRARSWDKKWTHSLLGGKKHRDYKTERMVRPAYVHDPYPTLIPADKVYKVRSNPSLVKINNPTSVSSYPVGVMGSDRRVFVVDDHHHQPYTTQSMILTRSPRFSRSQKFSGAGSLDMSHDHIDDRRLHEVSHDYSHHNEVFVDGAHSSNVNQDPESNHLRWSPSMRRGLESKDRYEKSDSEITSVSRQGRRPRGVGEHKYIYNKQDGTLKQF